MNGVKVFLRYVDDIVRTVKGDPGEVLEAPNKLHPNLQFTIEELDRNGKLAFSDLNVNVDSAKKVTCGWYQKPTDTGTILNFRGCALLQYKRNVIEGTVHRVFRRTSKWEFFNQALEKNRKQWIENQYPKSWSDRVVCNIRPNTTQRRSVEKVPINGWQASVTLILHVFHRLDLAS